MSDQKYVEGLAVRRQVMGDEFVDSALNSTTIFTQELQDFVTRNCWGEVWTRDGLSRKTRSLMTLSTLVALKATAELKGHVRGALRNGCSVDEIKEVLLHSAIYCGAPAAISAFKVAQAVINEVEK